MESPSKMPLTFSTLALWLPAFKTIFWGFQAVGWVLILFWAIWPVSLGFWVFLHYRLAHEQQSFQKVRLEIYLTNRLNEDEILNWSLPEGSWDLKLTSVPSPEGPIPVWLLEGLLPEQSVDQVFQTSEWGRWSSEILDWALLKPKGYEFWQFWRSWKSVLPYLIAVWVVMAILLSVWLGETAFSRLQSVWQAWKAVGLRPFQWGLMGLVVWILPGLILFVFVSGWFLSTDFSILKQIPLSPWEVLPSLGLLALMGLGFVYGWKRGYLAWLAWGLLIGFSHSAFAQMEELANIEWQKQQFVLKQSDLYQQKEAWLRFWAQAYLRWRFQKFRSSSWVPVIQAQPKAQGESLALHLARERLVTINQLQNRWEQRLKWLNSRASRLRKLYQDRSRVNLPFVPLRVTTRKYLNDWLQGAQPIRTWHQGGWFSVVWTKGDEIWIGHGSYNPAHGPEWRYMSRFIRNRLYEQFVVTP